MHADTAIVLLGHGSRDPLWREAMDAMAAAIRARSPDVAVGCAFLELCGPTLIECVQSLATPGLRSVRVLPVFIGLGKHLREDLPERLAALRAACPGLHIDALTPLAEQPSLTQLVADLALAPGAHP
jgi:sirohydrochlorin cobaltochelatase